MILVTPRNVYGNLSVCGVRHVLVYVSVLGLNVSLGGRWGVGDVASWADPPQSTEQWSCVYCTHIRTLTFKMAAQICPL